MSNQLLSGTVQSGAGSAVPLGNVIVNLYEATNGAGILLGGYRTRDDGRFYIESYRPTATTVFYVTARVGERGMLMTVLGTEIPASIVINELTTVAAAFSMAQFADGATLQGGAGGLRTAAAMCANLADPLTGQPSQVLLNGPNGDQTIALRTTRSLGNLLAACARGAAGVEGRFLELATPPGGPPPADTFQALLSIARNPANNVGALYSQSQSVPTVFSPPLFNAPDAWTLAVKVNNTGSDDSLFGGPANFAFDQNGRAWIPNNVVQGGSDSARFIVVLDRDGRPAVGHQGSVTSPVLGGGLKGPGWGVTIDPGNHVWVGNFGWGPRRENPFHGSVSEFMLDGTPVSGEAGWVQETHRVQAVVSDGDGNIWMASYGNNRIVVYPGGDPTRAQWLPSGGDYPFGIAVAPDGTVWLSNSGGLGWPQANDGSVGRFRLDRNGTLVPLQAHPVKVGKACKVIAVDAKGNAWLASGGDSTVYQLSPDGQVVGAFTGVGGMDGPWGICVDGDDDVWVANFGTLGLEYDFTTAALSVLAGDSEKTRRAGLRPGDPLSPSTGYTLPSAGDPVLLHNGDPVYRDGTECYTPLMRATSCQIDRAGNVWVVNNWKPRFRTDFDAADGNPGGDGVVIFVGLARPPRT